MSGSASVSEGETAPCSRRIARACDSCYRRKIKCDPVGPQCNWCRHHNIPCTFSRVVRSRKGKRNHFQNEPSWNGRVGSRETLQVGRPSREDDHTENHAVASNGLYRGSAPPYSGPFFGKLHLAGRRLGNLSSCSGVPLFSPEGLQWVQSRTDQNVSLEKLCSFGLPWQSHRAHQLNMPLQGLSTGNVDLPDIDHVKLFVSSFSCSVVRLVFPFIDPVLFEDTLRLAYQPSANDQYGTTSAKACVCSFLAVAGIFNFREGGAPSIDGEAFAWKAQSLLPRISFETTIDGLQTSLMLSIFHLLSGNLQPAIFVNNISAGLIFVLGAHTPSHESCRSASPCPKIQPRRERHLRSLFWVCYTLDKELSLRTEQPPAINDEHCDLTLPPGYGKHWYTDWPSRISPGDAFVESSFPGDLRLSMIKSRAYNILYSVRALQKSDAELLKSIREIDHELEMWRVSLPPKYRPTVSFSRETLSAHPDMNLNAVMIRLEYHHCMAMIHQASERCTVWADNGTGVTEALSSSLALSVEASRSSLSYLQTAQHVLVGDCFWVVLFYPMSAVITLFCNILLHPLGPSAVKDLELISNVPALIRGFPIWQFTANEVIHIKRIDDFVAELGRLAKCAIVKASK